MCKCRCDSLDEKPLWVRIFWGFLFLALAAFWGSIFQGCASWREMDRQQKAHAVVEYYETFSAGLRTATLLLPADKQEMALAALKVADDAIERLDNVLDANIDHEAAQNRVQGTIETANAIVGAANG